MFVKELKLQGRVIFVKCDSQSSIYLSKNSTYHERIENIDIRLHFIKEKIESREVKVMKVVIDHNVTDTITKDRTLVSIEMDSCFDRDLHDVVEVYSSMQLSKLACSLS